MKKFDKAQERWKNRQLSKMVDKQIAPPVRKDSTEGDAYRAKREKAAAEYLELAQFLAGSSSGDMEALAALASEILGVKVYTLPSMVQAVRTADRPPTTTVMDEWDFVAGSTGERTMTDWSSDFDEAMRQAGKDQKPKSTRKYLFIGGAADGEWIATDDAKMFRAAHVQLIQAGDFDRMQAPIQEVSEFSVYHRQSFAIGEMKTSFYVAEELGAGEDAAFMAFERLLRGYRPSPYRKGCKECEWEDMAQRRKYDQGQERYRK